MKDTRCQTINNLIDTVGHKFYLCRSAWLLIQLYLLGSPLSTVSLLEMRERVYKNWSSGKLQGKTAGQEKLWLSAFYSRLIQGYHFKFQVLQDQGSVSFRLGLEITPGTHGQAVTTQGNIPLILISLRFEFDLLVCSAALCQMCKWWDWRAKVPNTYHLKVINTLGYVTAVKKKLKQGKLF